MEINRALLESKSRIEIQLINLLLRVIVSAITGGITGARPDDPL